ncbi:MAG: histidine kinase [Bacteroidia bacterium]|nr:histidine kinase [Bacteroidia bacterium]
MKTIILCLSAFTGFLFFPVSSNGKQVPVKLNAGEELIYEWTEKEVTLEKESFISGQFKTIRYLVLIDEIENNKVFFTIQTLRNKTEIQGLGASDSEDRGFPQLVNIFWVIPPADQVNETLYQKKIHYELDLNTRNIQLANSAELFGQFESSMLAKGYSDEIRLSTIKEIKVILQKPLFLEPFLFLNSDIDQSNIHQQDLDLNFKTTKRNEEQMELSSIPDNQQQNCRCTVNLQYGLVTNFSKNSIEYAKDRKFRLNSNYRVQINQQLTLLQKSFPKQPKVIISGHIENPVSDQVVVYTLNKCFGTDLDSKMVYLDKTGNFRMEAKLENKGLVIVTNPNGKQDIPGPVILLYAEPGDSIYLNTRLVMKQLQERIIIRHDSTSLVKKEYLSPEEIAFSGDRKMEAELLNKFQGQMGLPPFHILNNHLYVGGGKIDAKIYLNALNMLEKLMIKSPKNLTGESTSYLGHELQAYIYSRLFEARPSELGKGIWFSVGPDLAENMKDMVQSQLDTFNINHIYNDYGLFSRGLTLQYVRYKHNRLIPLSNLMIRNFQLRWMDDIEQSLQFNKLVLTGSPLYREMADQLYKYSSGPFNAFTKTNNMQWQRMFDETFELMIKRCNDGTFINALKDLRNSQLNWNDLRFIPDQKFLNLQKQYTKLRSFITEKPSIIYSSDDWSVGRYEMDELSPKNTEINFVLINDGSNYELWKSWNDRAEPKAQQLFLINDSLRLKDIFQDKFKRYIIYNRSGERIGVESDLKDAVVIAKKSLEPKKKEISKSTLNGIIQLLSLALFLFLVVFLIYKYRMRLQLKKQGQEKRLRELQMAAIRAQMNPHFLFNSLNSVQNLIQQNRTQEAHLYLSDFAGLIRKVLRNSEKEEVSLAEELEMVEQYLNLEKLRFDFEYTIYVDDQIDQNLFMLPSMILQPIAENALTHGLQHKTGDKKISIRILKIENAIQIDIEDNGIGIQASQKQKTDSNGFGLRMNEERIQMMKEKNGGNYSFKLIDLSEQNQVGTRVEIIIPEEQ